MSRAAPPPCAPLCCTTCTAAPHAGRCRWSRRLCTSAPSPPPASPVCLPVRCGSCLMHGCDTPPASTPPPACPPASTPVCARPLLCVRAGRRGAAHAAAATRPHRSQRLHPPFFVQTHIPKQTLCPALPPFPPHPPPRVCVALECSWPAARATPSRCRTGRCTCTARRSGCWTSKPPARCACARMRVPACMHAWPGCAPELPALTTCMPCLVVVDTPPA